MSKTVSMKSRPSSKISKNGKAAASFPAPPALAVVTSAVETSSEAIPYLGETRRAALALAGLKTRDDLRRATVEEIGGVKGVGMVNAARVKDWLEAQDKAALPPAESPDPALAASNQHVQDIFEKLESAAARLKGHLPAKSRDKNLGRQLTKLDSVASELAEGPDTLSAKQVSEAVKTLDKIAALLETAAGAEKLSPRKQAVLIEELRARRKRLQKTLGD